MVDFIDGPNGRIAFEWFDCGGSPLPPVVFLCGFKSDMNGSKAQWLDGYCREAGRSFLRFDYFAHGESDGDFTDFTLSKAIDDTVFMLERYMGRPAVVIGSSMGGWIGLRLLEICPERVAGLIGIAPAPDFTAEIKASLTPAQSASLAEAGYFYTDSGYAEPYVFSQSLLDDGDRHCMLGRTIDPGGRKITILQGKCDAAVPWQKAERIKAMLGGEAEIVYVDDGDHSLSRPQDLQLLKSLLT